MEEEIIKGIIAANGEDVYKDAAQPSLRVVGKTLSQCVSLFISPIGHMAEILENNLNKYIDRLGKLKEEEIVSPNVRILVPVLEKLRYIDDEIVADYYIQILTAASSAENYKKVMISYIAILDRLCSDEIKIFEFINSFNNHFILTDKEKKEKGVLSDIVDLDGDIPVIDVKIHEKVGSGYNLIFQNFSNINRTLELQEPNNINIYLDNMISLGILKRINKKILGENVYKLLKEDNEIKKIEATLKDGQKISFEEGIIVTTDLGKKLLELCKFKK